jgi:hypothetical protein
LERAITALVILVVTVMAVASVMAVVSVLSVTKDWLVALGVHAGIAWYNARVHSRLIVQDIALDLLTLTATVRGVSNVERGQTPLEAPIYVEQAAASACRPRTFLSGVLRCRPMTCHGMGVSSST